MTCGRLMASAAELRNGLQVAQEQLVLLLHHQMAAAAVGLVVEPQRMRHLRSVWEVEQPNVAMENAAVGTPVRAARRVVEVNGRVRESAMLNMTVNIRVVLRASCVAAVLPTI